MATAATARATLDDLYQVEGKAELIGGRIVRFMATGDYPARVAFAIAVALHLYARATSCGTAYPDNVGYAIPQLPSGRESFSPDASFYAGPHGANQMRFIPGPPTFAVEVRSENDYGPAAEGELASKRDDYFAAETLVVWDVDPLARTVTVFRASVPTQAVVYHPGETAEANPAVPGWQMTVDEIFSV
jgi:Uma2 family endonuclease